MPNDTCIFCQIVHKEIPATIRYEDEKWIAFDDMHKTAPQHVLLIPKTHYASLEAVDSVDKDFHAELLLTARKIAHQLGIQENYKLFVNVGKKVQAIHHLHLHIMGGWGKEKNRLGLDKESLDFINS
jgi:histidine triad (HIT) family protein